MDFLFVGWFYFVVSLFVGCFALKQCFHLLPYPRQKSLDLSSSNFSRFQCVSVEKLQGFFFQVISLFMYCLQTRNLEGRQGIILEQVFNKPSQQVHIFYWRLFHCHSPMPKINIYVRGWFLLAYLISLILVFLTMETISVCAKILQQLVLQVKNFQGCSS